MPTFTARLFPRAAHTVMQESRVQERAEPSAEGDAVPRAEAWLPLLAKAGGMAAAERRAEPSAEGDAEPHEVRPPLLAKAGGMAAGMSTEPSAEGDAEPRADAWLPLLAKAGGMAAGMSAEPTAEGDAEPRAEARLPLLAKAGGMAAAERRAEPHRAVLCAFAMLSCRAKCSPRAARARAAHKCLRYVPCMRVCVSWSKCGRCKAVMQKTRKALL